jgi:K+-transporting ATPase ATPase C chain
MIRRQLLTGLIVTVVLTVVLGVVYPLVVWGVSQVAFNHQANGSMVHVNGKVVGSALIGQEFTDKNGNPLKQYFQSRPSDAGSGYDAGASSASNLGPSNPLLIGFIPGTNSLGLDGNPSTTNPFATPADPYCVPTDPSGKAVATPSAGQKYAMNSDGSYICDPNTVPERTIAYRQLNNLSASAPVPVDAVTASGSGLDPDISVANALDQAARVAAARNLPATEIETLVNAHIQTRPWGVLGENTVNVLDLNLALDRLS